MKKVTIVGVGALGSHLALFLRNEADLRLVDDDRVEAKNVLSQLHPKMAKGKTKTTALAQMLMMFEKHPEGRPVRLSPANSKEVLSGSDLVIDCMDNAPSRRVLSDWARGAGVPCLHGALAANGEYGQVAWDEDFVPDEAPAGVPTCEDGGQLPFIAAVSSFLAVSARAFLRDGTRLGWAVSSSGALLTVRRQPQSVRA